MRSTWCGLLVCGGLLVAACGSGASTASIEEAGQAYCDAASACTGAPVAACQDEVRNFATSAARWNCTTEAQAWADCAATRGTCTAGVFAVGGCDTEEDVAQRCLDNGSSDAGARYESPPWD
ncbi:MAG: hypothetical protein KA297_26910 [Kofleriaceae bacterium]|jgi:hypothetical protein|nr:hypothetical protein [Kofleriaceae bacterium]MBP6837407.1 hypothetical protein [Kofleriaceae bacterium]